jgi:hypothetical protein
VEKWAEGAQRVTRYILLGRSMYTSELGAPTWYIWQLPFCWGRSSVEMLIGIRQLRHTVEGRGEHVVGMLASTLYTAGRKRSLTCGGSRLC